MPIDIHAFRSMAAQSPDKAIYVSGDNPNDFPLLTKYYLNAE